MSSFGWSLPAGVITLPDEEPEIKPLACPKCDTIIINYSPSKTEPWEDWISAPESEDDGVIPKIGPFRGEGEGREWLCASGTNIYYKCPKCCFDVKDPNAT